MVIARLTRWKGPSSSIGDSHILLWSLIRHLTLTVTERSTYEHQKIVMENSEGSVHAIVSLSIREAILLVASCYRILQLYESVSRRDFS